MIDNKVKKVLIIAGIFLLVIATIATALNIMTKGSPMRQNGFNAPGGTGMPSGSMMPDFGMGESSDMMTGAPEGKMAASVPARDASYSQEGSSGSETVEISKKIVKNGDLTLKVNSVDSASEKVSEISENLGGSVLYLNIWKASSGAKSGTITVKVPVDKFSEAIDQIKKVAVLVIRESANANDVTEQYVDLEARLNNKKAEEKAFADILARSSQIDDTIRVTRELARVRGEIESLEAQKKLLESRTDMSTISIALSEDENITISDSWRPLQVAKDAVNSLVQKVQKFINFVIILIVTIVPVFVLYILLFWVIFIISRKIYRKFKKKDISGTETSEKKA